MCTYEIIISYTWNIFNLYLIMKYFKIGKGRSGTGEVAWLLRTLDAMTEDQSWNPSTYVGWLTTTCNFSSGGSDALFWPP